MNFLVNKKGMNYSETISHLKEDTQKLNREEYENCEFIHCIFSDLSNLKFINCAFKFCDLSNCKLNNSMFQYINFSDCKLLGINFSQAKDFAFALFCKNCNLEYASFDKKKLNKSVFENCKMHHVNFTQADLSKTSLLDCDLLEAHFSNTNMMGVDFTKSKNFLIDPNINTIKKAKFLAQDLEKLLFKYEIVVE